MKDKKLKLRSGFIPMVLGIILILVWSRVFFAVSGASETKVEIETQLPQVQIQNVMQKENRALKTNYRDPFKRRSNIQVEKRPLKAPKTISNEGIKEHDEIKELRNDRVIWPEIQFKGMILNRSTGEKIAVLLIKKMEWIAHEGEEMEGIKIQLISDEKLEISHNKNFKTIYK